MTGGVTTGLWKAGATMGAVVPVAFSAVAAGAGAGAAAATPTVLHVLGYPFEAGSMIAAISACVCVRFYVSQTDKEAHRWTVDLPITLLAVMFTAAGVIRLRPDPAMALMLGTGLGALGAGIIAIAKAKLDRVFTLLGLDNDDPKPAD